MGGAPRSFECQGKFSRLSGRFNLTCVGKRTLMRLFTEMGLELVRAKGRIGVITPTGIATDETAEKFFGKIVVGTICLSRFFDFENRELLFPDVAPIHKFCLLPWPKLDHDSAEFAFLSHQVEHLQDPVRRFTITQRILHC